MALSLAKEPEHTKTILYKDLRGHYGHTFAHKIDFQMNKNCVLFLFSVTRPDMSPPSVMIVSVSRYQYCH